MIKGSNFDQLTNFRTKTINKSFYCTFLKYLRCICYNLRFKAASHFIEKFETSVVRFGVNEGANFCFDPPELEPSPTKLAASV